MKLLLVDDSRDKIRKVKECLASVGVIEGDIDVALCIIDAKRLLSSNAYDLLILDVALPNRPEDDPSERGGPDLLKEIIEREHLYKPRYIVGLTAYPNLFDSCAGEFGDHLWSINQFKQDEDGWCDGIKSLIHHINSIVGDTRNRKYQYDLGVIVALNDPEFIAIKELDWGWEKHEVSGDPVEYYTGSIKLQDDSSLSVVAAVSNRMGMVSSAILTTKIIEHFCPQFIAMTGICAGIKDRCEFGDVIVADPVWDYQSGKRQSETCDFQIDPHQLPIRNAIRRRFRELSENYDVLSKIKNQWPGVKPRSELKLHVGPVASGSQVLADSEHIKKIILQQRKLMGIEMEIYGMYAAGDEARCPQPNYFALKSVCDFADDKKNDTFQQYAAYTSAKVLEIFVQQNLAQLKLIL